MTRAGFKRVYIKARSGRGRKRATWVSSLHDDLLQDFEELRKTGMKFNATLLPHLALHLIGQSRNDRYNKHMRDTESGKLIVDMITLRWVQSSINRFRIVSRAQTGKLMLCPEKRPQMERDVAFHLGTLSRQFASGLLDENHIGNADETNFLINLDNHRTLGRCGEK